MSQTRERKEWLGLQVKVDASFFPPLFSSFSGSFGLDFILFVAAAELRCCYSALLNLPAVSGSSMSSACGKRMPDTALTFGINVSNFISGERFLCGEVILFQSRLSRYKENSW